MSSRLLRLRFWKELLELLFFWLPGLPLLWILAKFIPPARRYCQQLVYDAMDDNNSFDRKDFEDTVDSYHFMRACLRSQCFDKLKEAMVGYEAPNPRSLTLETKKEVKILDFQNKARPLVISFGNCT